ncbi:MAG: penicillin-binding protein [Thermosediminibacterales bacterium]|nr:penicillin-binding protein [Thermosediminibacterales bacterium]
MFDKIRKLLLSSALISILIIFSLTFIIELPETQVYTSSIIYDKNYKVIDRLFIQNRTQVSLNKMSKYLPQAFIAVEDYRFYKHIGIDPIGIMRALYVNLKAMKIVEGGSTITQQLAKNLYLTHERSLKRKIKEALLTLKLELLYSKKHILEMYLNQIYLGSGTYGVEAAAQTYFGKHAKELNLAECAMLAGLTRSPEYYSPFKNFEAAKARQAIVLNKMVEHGYISKTEAEKAKKTPIILAKPDLKISKAPYFTQYIINEIAKKNKDLVKNLYKGGYKIYTSLDLDIQETAKKALLSKLGKGTPDQKGILQPQGAVVVIDTHTGYILSMVGGRDYSNTQFNRALAQRQPGSAFKPFLYTAVINIGFNTTTTKICEPVQYPKGNGEVYEPKDYDGGYHYRPITVREALAISDNVVSVKWMYQIKPKRVIDLAKSMGISSPLSPNLSLALGSSAVTPLEMAAGYCPLANGGFAVTPIGLLKVEDKNGNIVLQNTIEKRKAIDENVAYIVTDMLKDVLKPGGTGSHLKIYGPAAGKTGTTQFNRDAWFIGYTPNISVSVYVGNDNPKKSLWSTGGWIAGPIWQEIINYSFTKYPAEDFPIPPGVKVVNICKTSLALPNWTCPTRREVFVSGREPKEWCTINHLLPQVQDNSFKNNNF